MANIEDILTISIVLFIVGVATMFIVKTGHEINSNLANVPIMNNTPGATTIIDSADTAVNMSDYIYLALFISFFVGLIIGAWYIGGEPILAPIYFFVLIFFTFVSVIIQKVWVQISQNSNVITTLAQLPITNYILSHLGYFTAIFGLISIVIMFGKARENTYGY
jgi:hypothetical protein